MTGGSDDDDRRIVATDDVANRLVFRWLGPVNMPAPVPARGTAWLMGLLAWPMVTFAVGAILPQAIVTALARSAPLGLLISTSLTLLLGTAGTIVLVRTIGSRITMTRPLGHHVALFKAELTDPRPEREEEIVVSSTPWNTHTRKE